MKTRPFASFLLATSVFLGACGEKSPEPLDVREVALNVETNFRHVAVELVRALTFLRNSETLGGWFGDDCTSSPQAGWGGDAFFGDEEDEYECDSFDIEAMASALVDELSTRIFTEENVESNRDGVLTFRLRPEVVCVGGGYTDDEYYDDEYYDDYEDYDYDDDYGVDEDCFDLLSRLPIRLRVTSDAPGDLDIAVLVGSQRIRPFEFSFHREDLRAEVDLAALQATVELLHQGPAPFVMTGRAQLGLARHAEGRFTASVSILEAVSFESTRGRETRLHLGTAYPAVSVEIDEAASEVRLTSGLGRMDFLAPLASLVPSRYCDGPIYDDEGYPYEDDCGDDEELEGNFSLRLGGLTGTLTLSSRPGVDEIHIDGLGFGAESTVIEVDGAPVLRFDLNEDLGRKVDVLARAERSGTTLQFSPALDVKVALDFVHLSRLGDIPSWMMEETLRIRLDGASAPRIHVLASDSLDWDDEEAGGWRESEGLLPMLQVLAGTLRLDSTHAGSLEVAAGMCLFDSSQGWGYDEEGEPSAAHPFESMFADSCE